MARSDMPAARARLGCWGSLVLAMAFLGGIAMAILAFALAGSYLARHPTSPVVGAVEGVR
jgi:hypothetical protein